MMKNILFILVVLILSSSVSIAGNKVELKWKKFDTGLAEAKKAKKKILLDVYADWCKWCKKLDSEVYENENIAAYLNKYYIIVKINGESSSKLSYKGQTLSEQQLTQALGVTGFPTIIFLDSEGSTIDKLGGFVPADKFFPIIQYIGEDHYKTTKFEDFLKKNIKK